MELEVLDHSSVSKLLPLSRVNFILSGRGFTSQGVMEDASPTGFETWMQGAKTGILFALQVMQAPGAEVLVTRITGRDGTETNPWIVAEAAAKSIWQAYSFAPDAETVLSVEAVVNMSWQNDGSEPDFSRILSRPH